MGLFIHLFANPNRIAAEQWEAAYQETRQILAQFPLSLMTAKQETRYGGQRWTYTRNLVQDAGCANEFWEVSGDMVSLFNAGIDHCTV